MYCFADALILMGMFSFYELRFDCSCYNAKHKWIYTVLARSFTPSELTLLAVILCTIRGSLPSRLILFPPHPFLPLVKYLLLHLSGPSTLVTTNNQSISSKYLQLFLLLIKPLVDHHHSSSHLHPSAQARLSLQARHLPRQSFIL